MYNDILRRYGFGYDSRNSTPAAPPPPGLYDPYARVDNVMDHGQWCAKKCVYPQNEKRIDDIMLAHMQVK